MDSLHVRVPAADVDLVVDLLWQCGVAGIEERAADAAVDAAVDAAGEEDAVLLIAGHAHDDDAARFWDRVEAMLGDRWPWHRQRYDAGAAADAWRPFARAVEIGGVLVCPVWLESPGDHPAVLHLEPGRAWGHGSHPSTVLAGELILDSLPATPPRAFRVLDVGCGSGVLSLLAAQRGATVVAIDLDAEALAVTEANAIRNHLEPLVAVGSALLADAEAPFDVVAANLGIRAIVELAPQLAHWVRPGGCLVLSGLLGTQIGGILAMSCWADWAMTGRRDDEQWSAIRLRAPDDGQRGAPGQGPGAVPHEAGQAG